MMNHSTLVTTLKVPSVGTCVALLMGMATTSRAQTFAYTSADQTYTVPPNVLSLNVSLWGAGGAINGGSGSYVSGTLAVTPGEKLTIMVGEGGLGGTFVNQSNTYGDGGNSQGAHDVLTGSGGGLTGIFYGSTPLAIAGSGGSGSQVTIGAYASHGGGGGGILVGNTSDGGVAGGSQISGGDSTAGYLQGGNGQLRGTGSGGGSGLYGGGSGNYDSADYYIVPAGGGSSLISGLTNVTSIGGTNGLPSGSASGGAGQDGYMAGIGTGGIGGPGSTGPIGDGGNGEVVFSIASTSAPEPCALAVFMPACGAMLATRRKDKQCLSGCLRRCEK